jgi:hypothetical protein
MNDYREVCRLLEEAGRLAEQIGMPPEDFVACFAEVLQKLMIEQGERP